MTKAKRRTPAHVYRAVCERAEGLWVDGYCIGGYCENCGSIGDWRGLQFAHWFKHRKLGGTTDPDVHSTRNIKRCCALCHDLHDRRCYAKEEE